MKITYIQTLDMTFKNITVLNANSEKELLRKIKANEIIKILNENEIEYINPTYIMYLKID